MEERKLNFNAPLLSVRRFAATSASSDTGKRKITGNFLTNRRRNPSVHEPDASLDQVTEPVAVPFMWEQIPGKVKDGMEPESQPPEDDASITPRLPPGRALDIVKHNLDRDFNNEIVARPVMETYLVNDDVTRINSSKDGRIEKWGSDWDSDEDLYSDALDVLSPTDSHSINCSISGLSGSDGWIVNPSGNFSTDPQTRDFMMSRFLPAAKAMALKPPQYASKKQNPQPEQPREVKKIVVEERKPPVNQCRSIIIPHYDQNVDEEDTESEVGDEYNDASNISRKGCGLLPRLCFKNSMCLLNPVPGLKVRTRSLTSSTSAAGKLSKSSSMESHIEIVKKHAWDAFYNKRSDSRVQSPRLLGIGDKVSTYKSNQLPVSDQQTSKKLSPDRLPGSGRISPYRRPRPQSPFRGGGFLGVPKGSENFKAGMLISNNRNYSKSQELSSYQNSRQSSGLSSPAVEKTLYVDTVSCPADSFPNAKGPMDSQDKNFDLSQGHTTLEETTAEYSLQDEKWPITLEQKGITRSKLSGSMVGNQNSFSGISHVRIQPEVESFNQDERLNEECKYLVCVKIAPETNLDPSVDDTLAADGRVESNACSDLALLPPPLPKTPSESWLWRTLPSVSARNSFSRSRFLPKKEEVQTDDCNTKWETIVKTSYLHRDHVRYSEELVSHVPRQPEI